MKTDKEIFQCGCCGTIHKVDSRYKPKEDIIYVPLWCDKCRSMTMQLYCGDEENGLYELYDVNMDPKYYKY